MSLSDKIIKTEPETKINVCVVFYNYKWHVMTICSCNVDWSASNCRIFQSVGYTLHIDNFLKLNSFGI